MVPVVDLGTSCKARDLLLTYLNVEAAVLVVGVIAVQLDVDAFADPRQSHDDEQLDEEDELVSCVVGLGVGRRSARSGFGSTMVPSCLDWRNKISSLDASDVRNQRSLKNHALL